MFSLKKSAKDDVYDIYLDGEICQNAWAYGRKGESRDYEIISKQRDVSKKIANYTLSELPHFVHTSLRDLFDWINFKHYLSLTQDLIKDEANEYIKSGFLQIGFSLFPDLSEWKENYTFTEYQTEFNQIWISRNITTGNSVTNNDESRSTEIEFKVFPDANIPIIELIASHTELVKDIHEEAVKSLDKNSKKYVINETFNFPDKIKSFCEQYLLYFAKFLQDLNIKATSDVKEEAGKVLFSVTPTDDVEALDKIREALAVYLKLPESPIVYDDSFAAMRLQQQIENLQHSQKMAVREIQVNEKLMLAQSDVIREKNITISQQQSVIENQNKIIEKISSKSIMMDSVENKEELEEIYDGLKIGESKFLKEQLGIHLNPAKVIKTVVKNTLGKNKDISIINSEEK